MRPIRAAPAHPLDLSAFNQWQDMFRAQLNRPLRRLIPQLTGLRLHVLWHRAPDFQRPGGLPILCPKARRRAGANRPQPERCERCLQCRWQLALSPGCQGRRFSGRCGATNFCACLQMDGVCPLSLVLQARVRGRSSTSPAALHRAIALARLILHDLAATAQARLATSALGSASDRSNYSQSQAPLLRAELRRSLPGITKATAQTRVGSRARKLVAAVRSFVHQHYHRPIGLSDVASAMGMNGSYLSALFSRTTGMTFHRFVAEVRLSAAKTLLRDPRNHVKEVACAAGYASADAFRHAFKASEGLAPGAWRAAQ